MFGRRLFCAIVVGLWVCLGTFHAQSAEEFPEYFRDHLERIESAYSAGREVARDAEEERDCLLLRNGALSFLVEMTYESLLAWMADREDLLESVELDQGEWLAEMESLPPRDKATIAELEETSRILLERLQRLGVLTSKPFCPERDAC